MKFVTGVLALLVAASGFGQLGGVPGRLPESASNVRFATMASGIDLATNSPGLYVFNEPVGWSNYWRAHHRSPVPNLEPGFFNNWRLVAIHAGVRPTSGYGLTVTRIDRHIDRATISVVETTPMRGARNSQVATSPWTILRVERGAFGFDLRTQQVAEQYGAVPNGTVIKIGDTTIIMTGGGGCDHCNHRGRQGCRCGRGEGCTCTG